MYAGRLDQPKRSTITGEDYRRIPRVLEKEGIPWTGHGRVVADRVAANSTRGPAAIDNSSAAYPRGGARASQPAAGPEKKKRPARSDFESLWAVAVRPFTSADAAN